MLNRLSRLDIIILVLWQVTIVCSVGTPKFSVTKFVLESKKDKLILCLKQKYSNLFLVTLCFVVIKKNVIGALSKTKLFISSFLVGT
jgi:hypothetical protein